MSNFYDFKNDMFNLNHLYIFKINAWTCKWNQYARIE